MSITHNQTAKRFEMAVPGGMAYLSYEVAEDQIRLLYVQVPRESQGKGFAAELTRTAIEYGKAQSLHIVPVCGYTRAYMQRQSTQTDS